MCLPAKEEIKETAREQARCRRDQGYEVGDPEDGAALRVPQDVRPEDLRKCLPGRTQCTENPPSTKIDCPVT
ncbi:hypothetical protein [Streptosporangium roseum]|uniref:Uncharacterized protein n=1 Tax=Streptosporangium roseum (strain ATCC 12428 / DSM 43021 / JCM 3005 / KCTC 9067 / NCIMB 10171 / NRRL 2505 / NI 9100) TaxID=479432 RepID=D2B5K8_STRRD|nr:hypothetical protein [Streptosporangium roseum]ACZ89513.1 hypothetical protein Sros_6804 [Streptosporangium roseum DSM 43021]